jgi:hypothetical protein
MEIADSDASADLPASSSNTDHGGRTVPRHLEPFASQMPPIPGNPIIMEEVGRPVSDNFIGFSRFVYTPNS